MSMSRHSMPLLKLYAHIKPVSVSPRSLAGLAAKRGGISEFLDRGIKEAERWAQQVRQLVLREFAAVPTSEAACLRMGAWERIAAFFKTDVSISYFEYTLSTAEAWERIATS
eukprot:scaffold254315_cov21-Tisochrysis_lutea.AAC.1